MENWFFIRFSSVRIYHKNRSNTEEGGSTLYISLVGKNSFIPWLPELVSGLNGYWSSCSQTIARTVLRHIKVQTKDIVITFLKKKNIKFRVGFGECIFFSSNILVTRSMFQCGSWTCQVLLDICIFFVDRFELSNHYISYWKQMYHESIIASYPCWNVCQFTRIYSRKRVAEYLPARKYWR